MGVMYFIVWYANDSYIARHYLPYEFNSLLWRQRASNANMFPFDVEGCYKTQYNVRSVFSIAFVPAVPEFVIHKYEIIYVSFADRWLIYHMS